MLRLRLRARVSAIARVRARVKLNNIAATHNRSVCLWADVLGHVRHDARDNSSLGRDNSSLGRDNSSVDRDNSSLFPSDACFQVWGGGPTEAGKEQAVAAVARAGYRVVRSTGYYLSSG